MKRALITIVTIAVVAVGGFFVVQRIRAAAPADKTQYRTTKAEVGLVKKTVTATGTLQPWKVVDIKSKAGGRVDKLLVDVGSIVRSGQTMALIDRSDTQLAVNTAQADIDSANARELQSDRMQRLQVEQSKLTIVNARAALTAARASRTAARSRLDSAMASAKAQPDLTDSFIKSAQANLDQTKRAREQLDATHQQQVAAAKSALDSAIANMKNAQANLDRQKKLLDRGFVAQQVVDSAQASYEVYVSQVDQARKKSETIGQELKADIDVADARVAQAQSQLNNAKFGKVDVENRNNAVAEARATLKQWDAQVVEAQSQLATAIANQANNEIKTYDTAVAKASIARANATMVNAKNTLDQTTVQAPSAGIVLKKYVEEGTIITSGLSLSSTGTNIVSLGDIRRMYVDVTVDETDISNVLVGQAVDISVEAYSNASIEGKVVRIDPQADVIQNVTMFHVRVEIDNSANEYRLLKPGMNATCEFVSQKKEDVLSVPAEAVHSTGEEDKYVEIAVGGIPNKPADAKAEVDPKMLVDVKPLKRTVKVGLEGNDTVEILEGLKEGDVVITQKIEPVAKTAGSPFSQQRPGGFGGRGGGR